MVIIFKILKIYEFLGVTMCKCRMFYGNNDKKKL